MTAPRGIYDESGGEGGITSSSFAMSRSSSFVLNRFVDGPGDAKNVLIIFME